MFMWNIWHKKKITTFENLLLFFWITYPIQICGETGACAGARRWTVRCSLDRLAVYCRSNTETHSHSCMCLDCERRLGWRENTQVQGEQANSTQKASSRFKPRTFFLWVDSDKRCTAMFQNIFILFYNLQFLNGNNSIIVFYNTQKHTNSAALRNKHHVILSCVHRQDI